MRHVRHFALMGQKLCMRSLSTVKFEPVLVGSIHGRHLDKTSKEVIVE
jgi:hypothetical protein